MQKKCDLGTNELLREQIKNSTKDLCCLCIFLTPCLRILLFSFYICTQIYQTYQILHSSFLKLRRFSSVNQILHLLVQNVIKVPCLRLGQNVYNHILIFISVSCCTQEARTLKNRIFTFLFPKLYQVVRTDAMNF